MENFEDRRVIGAAKAASCGGMKGRARKRDSKTQGQRNKEGRHEEPFTLWIFVPCPVPCPLPGFPRAATTGCPPQVGIQTFIRYPYHAGI